MKGMKGEFELHADQGFLRGVCTLEVCSSLASQGGDVDMRKGTLGG